jgi:hypothetical protein
VAWEAFQTFWPPCSLPKAVRVENKDIDIDKDIECEEEGRREKGRRRILDVCNMKTQHFTYRIVWIVVLAIVSVLAVLSITFHSL